MMYPLSSTLLNPPAPLDGGMGVPTSLLWMGAWVYPAVHALADFLLLKNDPLCRARKLTHAPLCPTTVLREAL